MSCSCSYCRLEKRGFKETDVTRKDKYSYEYFRDKQLDKQDKERKTKPSKEKK